MMAERDTPNKIRKEPLTSKRNFKPFIYRCILMGLPACGGDSHNWKRKYTDAYEIKKLTITNAV